MSYVSIVLAVLAMLVSFNFAHATEYNVDIREIDLNYAKGISFDKRKQFDLNNDGINDEVKCSSNHWLQIISGKDGKRLYNWSGPGNENEPTYRRFLSGCAIVRVGHRVVVLISNHSRWKSSGWLKNSDQYAAYFNGSRFVLNPINVEGFGRMRSASRRINCHSYPKRLVELGYKRGALCFNSDYAADYRNRSALLKLEFSGEKLIFKDISASSGLMWRSGVRGTDIFRFRVGSGFKSNQRDGAFMMGAAFLDFDRDGLIDFVTVGQHASLRAHKITVDTARAEGIRVSHSYVHRTSRDTLSELLNVKSFNDFDERIKIPCFYTSGEGHEGGLHQEGDRVYCYENSRWVRKNLPRVLSSQYAGARIRPAGNGHMYMRVENRRADNSVISKHLFSFRYVGNLNGSASLWKSREKKDLIHVGGHACRQNGTRGVTVRSFSMPIWFASKVLYDKTSASDTSASLVEKKCMTPNEVSRSYKQSISGSSLLRGNNQAIYTYAFDNRSGAKKLIGVSTYNKDKDGRLSNMQSLPMSQHKKLTVSWTSKGKGWTYSLDIVDHKGQMVAPCQPGGVLKGSTKFTFREGRCHKNKEFSPGPKSRIRICGSPTGFSVPGTATCSRFRPVYGPKMHIDF